MPLESIVIERCILIVEDDQDFSDSITEILTAKGYVIKAACSVNSAEQLITEFDAQVALIDIRLGRTSGINLISKFKEISPGILCILITAYADSETAIKALKQGAYDYLIKPFQIEELLHTLDRCYEKILTDYKQERAEELLRESEERYRSLIETATDAIILADGEGKITSINQSAEIIFGYNKDEICGKPLTQLMPERFRKAHSEGIKRATETGVLHTAGKTIEVRGLRKDNKEFSLELSIAIWKVGDKTFYGGIIRDISERKSTEENLRKLSQAVEQSPATVIITDTEGNIEYVNPKFCELTGYSCEEVLGQNPRILKSGDKSPEEYKDLWDTITSGREWRGEFHNKKKNGELFWEQASVSPIKNEAGEITHFLAVKENITERKKAEKQMQEKEKQLRQAQKMEAVGTLAGGVAHDFNNMLTSIIGYTEITMDNLDEESNNYNNLKQVLNASFHARDIVAQLMAYTRKTKEDKIPLQIDKIISDTLKLLSSSLPISISLQKEIEEDIQIIMGNATQIQQVLMNLCINAEQAMPEGGTLKVTLKNLDLDKFEVLPGHEISGAYVLLSVEDNGIGMDKATVERVFDPFFTTKEVGKGTGLGLSTVYGIVKQQHGYITVDSEKGKGTSFNIYLPAIKQGTKTISAEKPVKTGKESALFEDKERGLGRIETEISKNEITINIHGNASISKTEKDKLLEFYVLSRSEQKKIVVNCTSNVQQSLKKDGFDKFLEIKVSK